ncbi:MAG: alpha/beta hydrolase-fold protein [Candidatus Faecousia sp.]|nr:alpha/beta hydrolase-fold protein [Candidatus Faecousia sp.]
MVYKWDVTIPQLSGDTPRRAYIWLPEDYEEREDKRYPVMYMFDGHNVFFDEDATFGKSWGMAKYLYENPKDLIIVAVECNHEGNRRLVEYAPMTYDNSEHGHIRGKGSVMMNWMVKELKPYIDATYRTLPDRKNTIIAGSSMGGLIALYGVTVYNHVFQRGACLSPSLWVAPGKVLEFVARAHIRRDTLIYMDYGELEMFNHAATQESMISTAHLLLTKRVNLALRIVPGGTHSEASWEKQIPVFMDCLGL